MTDKNKQDTKYIDDLFKIAIYADLGKAENKDILTSGIADVKAKVIGYNCAMSLLTKKQRKLWVKMYDKEIDK